MWFLFACASVSAPETFELPREPVLGRCPNANHPDVRYVGLGDCGLVDYFCEPGERAFQAGRVCGCGCVAEDSPDAAEFSEFLRW